MKTKFIFHPINDTLPPTPSEVNYKNQIFESELYELSSPFDQKNPNSKYWLRCFKCGIVANLGLHDVQVSNGLIIISPSILCPRQSCQNHYYIKNSEVIQA